MSLIHNRNLCQYLTKMIKKLNIQEYCTDIHPKEINKFCKTFSNLEQLQCNIYQLDDLNFLIDRLIRYTKLSSLQVCCGFTFTEKIDIWLQNIADSSNINFRYQYIPFTHNANSELSMWIRKEV